MIRRIDAAFRTDQNGRINARDSTTLDTSVVGSQSYYSTGRTQLDQLPAFFPPSAEKVSILSFTVATRLAVEISDEVVNTPLPVYGKLGKVFTGITTLGDQTTSAGGFQPSITKVLPLPPDLTLLTTLYDPDNDPTPPVYQRGATDSPASIPAGFSPLGLQLVQTVTLSAPVPIPRGTVTYIGLWLNRALVRAAPSGNVAVALVVMDSTYSIVYDDGEGRP